ncbi:hypothetical protein ACFYSF_30110 [Streptomyces canus]|uniref:hypothetical protein n=1 Tax=Streptomyces canus TaxID=58343 RepID=UPI0036CBE00A
MSEAALAARRRNAPKSSAIDTYVRKIVERAPELTDEHISKLRTLLRPVNGGAQE